MAGFKEIVTKAVIGKGKKTLKETISITPEEIPSTVLGCWVINHTFNGSVENGMVVINGSYDINIWYSFDKDHKTAVSVKKINYNNKLNVPVKSSAVLDDNSEIIIRSLKQPTVSDINLNDGSVTLSVEKDLGIEIIGEAKIRVNTEDDQDDYDEIVDESEIDKLVDQVDENYLNDVNQK